MELRQFEYVVAVVDHGTFTQAAVEVHVTQPSLSQGIRSLERELGVDLFRRVGRRAVLSAAGEAFVGPARRALRDAANARAAALAVRGLAAGHLDIATLPTLSVEPLAGWIGAFRLAHPGIDLRVVEPEDAPAIHRFVRDGQCEIGLAELPAPADLDAVPLGDQAIVAVAPTSLGLPRSGDVPLARLAEFPIVTTPVGTSTRDLIDAAFAQVGLRARVAVETSNREALLPLVAAGAGVTFLPSPLAERAQLDGLRVLRPEPAIRRTIGLVHRRGPLSPAAEAFLRTAVGS